MTTLNMDELSQHCHLTRHARNCAEICQAFKPFGLLNGHCDKRGTVDLKRQMEP